MTDFQPKPQTPEQVADGLRDAFRQAIKDGVMDATPYLKQMTYKSDIEKTEAEIKVLQKKLELLKEIETHKSQPRMNLENSGKFETVSYNGEFYVRMDYSYDSLWYKSKNTKNLDVNNLTLITDGETHRLLEGLWFNEVKKGKYDEPYCPDEPLEYDEVEWDEKDNPKPTSSAFRQKLFDGIESIFYGTEYQKTLWRVKVNMAVDEVLTHFYDILPEPEEYIGDYGPSQGYVDGWNHYDDIIKEKLN